jgi:hypothetical protein
MKSRLILSTEYLSTTLLHRRPLRFPISEKQKRDIISCRPNKLPCFLNLISVGSLSLILVFHYKVALFQTVLWISTCRTSNFGLQTLVRGSARPGKWMTQNKKLIVLFSLFRQSSWSDLICDCLVPDPWVFFLNPDSPMYLPYASSEISIFFLL